MTEPDPIDSMLDRLREDEDVTADAYIQGRRWGAFYAGLRAGAAQFRDELSVNDAVSLTESQMVQSGFDTAGEEEEDDTDG